MPLYKPTVNTTTINQTLRPYPTASALLARPVQTPLRPIPAFAAGPALVILVTIFPIPVPIPVFCFFPIPVLSPSPLVIPIHIPVPVTALVENNKFRPG